MTVDEFSQSLIDEESQLSLTCPGFTTEEDAGTHGDVRGASDGVTSGAGYAWSGPG